MSAFPWVLGGAAAGLGTYLWMRRAPDAADEPSVLPPVLETGPLPGRWVWPLGIWNKRKPEISDGFDGTRRDAKGAPIPHGGADLMYRRLPTDTFPVGSSNGSRNFILPEHRGALAASDGKVYSATYTRRGWSVVLDHGPRKVATYYTHLSQLLVAKGQTVHAGQPLGVVGADPLDEAHLKHLHFEVWRGGPNDRVDPAPLMRTWEMLADPGDLLQMLARNARQRVPHAPGETFVVRSHTRHYPRR